MDGRTRALALALVVGVVGCGETHGAPLVACSTDADCTTGRCDGARGFCGECDRDADCASGETCTLGVCGAPTSCASTVACPGLVCDTAAGRCVECTGDADCAAGAVCREDGRCAGARMLACRDDVDCGAEVCDPATRVCVGCVADDDCTGRCGPANECVECLDDADCAGGGRCAPSRSCVECLGDADCPATATCEANVCEPIPCLCVADADCDDGTFCNGEETCSATCLEGCLAGTPVACGVDEVCDEEGDACAPSCASPTRWFADADGDGWGDLADERSACTAPAGYVLRFGDCDDGDPDRSPDALEACDAEDDDCDLAIDDGCSCPTEGAIRVCGTDMGACTGAQQRCSSMVWGACTTIERPEVCNAIDDDCDGMADEAPASASCGASATCTAGTCSSIGIGDVGLAQNQSLARLTDGTVVRWASGASPTPVLGVDSATSLSVTRDLACALLPGGRAACMGQCFVLPTDGGPGMSCSSNWAMQFTDFGTIVGAVALEVGGFGGCFLDGAGAASCWGDGREAVLGSGAPTTERVLPRAILGISDAVDLAISSATACVVRRGGGVRCWGRGEFGQLGHGVVVTSSRVPVDVTGIDDAMEIGASETHFCVARASGEVWCWGTNIEGMLGDGTTVDRSAPVRLVGVPAGSRVASSMSGLATCVIAPPDDHVECVGMGTEGSLGDGLGANSRTPVRVTGLSGIVGLVGDNATWCAHDGEAAWCWGLIDGSRTLAPAVVTGLP